jgi:hypothetical protein
MVMNASSHPSQIEKLPWYRPWRWRPQYWSWRSKEDRETKRWAEKMRQLGYGMDSGARAEISTPERDASTLAESICTFVGGAVFLVTFLASWGYAIAEYGWFLGLGIGWFPAGVIALFAALLLGLLWPIVLLLALGLLFTLLDQGTR